MSNANHTIDICVDYTRPYLAIEIKRLRDAFLGAKIRGIKIRYLTEITKENLNYCKQLISVADELRHLVGIKGNFYVSEKEYAAPATSHEEGKSAEMMIHSTVSEFVEHQQYVFESIWNTSTTAERKIREIESEGNISLGITEVVDNPLKVQELFINIIKSAKFEILLVLPTVNAFRREHRIGAIQLLKEISEDKQRGETSIRPKDNIQEEEKRGGAVSVRILTPTDYSIHKILDGLNIMTTFTSTTSGISSEPEEENLYHLPYSYNNDRNSLHVRHLESLPEYNLTTVTLLVVDREKSLVIEKVDDSKESFEEAVGLSTYSTSEPTVMSYVSIFENFWNQVELYEQLKIANENTKRHDKMQQDFINIAAHELRTPLMPILGVIELVQSQFEDEDHRKDVGGNNKPILKGDSSKCKELNKNQELIISREHFEMMARNAKRLEGLARGILDVSRIESQTLKLNKEEFNINEKIRNVVYDIVKSSKDGIEMAFIEPKTDPIFVEADKIRIYEVVSNLLINSIKFSRKEGGSNNRTISEGKANGLGDRAITIVTVIKSNHKYEKDGKDGATSGDEVVVRVKDRGSGIDPTIQSRLFSKFVTKSEMGLGLGLFISKGIIEAHGGKLWAENNSDGKGATFSFSLPVTDS
jgi:two-component system, OmpR family, sensor histidine kinase VicK